MQPLSSIKTLSGPRVHGISLVGKERSMGERICQIAKSQVQNERLRQGFFGTSDVTWIMQEVDQL